MQNTYYGITVGVLYVLSFQVISGSETNEIQVCERSELVSVFINYCFTVNKQQCIGVFPLILFYVSRLRTYS